MDKMMLGIFQMEIKKQSSYVLSSASFINTSLANLGEPGTGDQLWYLVQGF